MLCNEVTEVIRQARERIAQPARWTQGALARGADGQSMSYVGPGAERYCMIGALDAVTPEWHQSGERQEALGWLADAATNLYASRLTGSEDSGGEIAAAVNDHDATQHADVLRVFDEAIRMYTGARTASP